MHYGEQTVTMRDIYHSYAKTAKKYAWVLVGVFVGNVIIQAASLAIPVFLSRFFNTLVAASVRLDTAAEQALYTTLLMIVGLYGVQWVGRRVFGFSIMVFEIRVMRDLYHATFAYLVRHSHHFFASQFSGTLTRRVSKYVVAFESLFDSLAMTFTPTALYIVGAISVLWTHNAILGCALALWSIIFLAFQVMVSLWRQPLRVARAEADSALVGGIADVITNQHTIMLFASAKHEEGLFAKLVERWRSAITRSWFADEYIWASQGILMIVVQVGLLYGAYYFWRLGKLTVGDFVLIQTYVLGIIDGLVNVTRELRRVYDAVADAGEMVAILKRPHDIQDAANAPELRVQGGSVDLVHVGFAYGEARQPVLEDFSLHVSAGQKIGVVGKSGAGKSTLVKLLLRHYDVDSGNITIDGQEIRSVTQDSLRSHISLVPQEPLLFHRSLRDNILYGNPGAGDEEMQSAAHKAYAQEFIERLPEKYETFVGERGVKLSGGERQRVAIARAILKNAPILILDEATASLDSESEVAIQKALHELMVGKTVIAIAHRLSTLREMDRIIVMSGGKIVEDGTHDQLLERGGIYADLWGHQAGGFLQDEE